MDHSTLIKKLHILNQTPNYRRSDAEKDAIDHLMKKLHQMKSRQNHSLQNLSALNYLKRKVNTGSKDKTTAATRSNKKNCRVCRDHFKVKEPQDSTKCPHLTTIDRKRPHEQKSGGNGVTDKNDKELLVLNDLELLVSNPTGIQVKIEKVHKDKLINLSNIIRREANINGESSDDQSAYTTADNFDPDNVSPEGKCKEKIRPGDVIQYYNPIFEAGDPCGLRETSVQSVDPANNFFPLVLSNGEALPSTSKVKRIKVIQHNRLVDHLGLFRSMDSYLLKKRGSATAADGVYMQAGYFDDVMKRHVTNAMGKATADDMLINKFHGGEGVGATDIFPTNSKKRTLSEDFTVEKITH